MSDKVIENLYTVLGFKYDEKNLNKFNKIISTGIKQLAKMVTVATAASGAMFAFTKKVAEANDELVKMSKVAGIDAATLQEMGYVAELGGSSIESMATSLEGLGRIASEAARGMGVGVEVFGILGINVAEANGQIKETDDLMMELSDRFMTLGSQAERLEFAQKLGISADLIVALQQGSDEFLRQRKEARELGIILDGETSAAAENFVDNLARIRMIMKGLSTLISTKFIKVFNPIIKLFIDWYKVNKEIIKLKVVKFIESLINIFTIFSRIGFRVLSIVNMLAQSLGGWENLILAVAAAWGILNAKMLLVPTIALAIAAGIFLLIEDLKTFAEGGDSAIGKLIERFPVLEKYVLAYIDYWKFLANTLGRLLSDPLEFIDDWVEGIKEIGKALKKYLVGPLSFLDNWVVGIKELGRIIVDKVQSDSPAIERQSPPGISSPTTTNNSTKNISINITGGDIQEVKRVITETLNEQYRGAKTSLESPIG